jgi:hypothetical protein
MTKGVGGYLLGDVCPTDCVIERLLELGLIKVIAPLLTSFRYQPFKRREV